MPLVTITLKNARTPQDRRRIADAVHNALVDSVGSPIDDRFQLVQTLGGDLIADPTYMGVQRTDEFVLVQVLLFPGKSAEWKARIIRAVADRLHEQAGLRREDVMVILHDVARENWSFGAGIAQSSTIAVPPPSGHRVLYKKVSVDGVNIFYREAGSRLAPKILLLHGDPTSSSMFRNLIPALADRFHVVAPDYPGYGESDVPPPDQYSYTFDNLSRTIDAFTRTLGIDRFAMYIQDFGAPVGFRIATRSPERITALIVQNGNAYEEGLDNKFWEPVRAWWKDPTPERRAMIEAGLSDEEVQRQYIDGSRDPSHISPDNYRADQAVLARSGILDIRMRLFMDYKTNPPLYPVWQAYLRDHQPPTLVVWGKNDPIFPGAGAMPYARDLRTIDLNLLDTGHFALEEDGDFIAFKIRRFMEEHVPRDRADTAARASTVRA